MGFPIYLWLKAVLIITLAVVSLGCLRVVWRLVLDRSYADAFSDARPPKPK